MNAPGLCAAYRTISPFHENPRLVAWLGASLGEMVDSGTMQIDAFLWRDNRQCGQYL